MNQLIDACMHSIKCDCSNLSSGVNFALKLHLVYYRVVIFKLDHLCLCIIVEFICAQYELANNKLYCIYQLQL